MFSPAQSQRIRDAQVPGTFHGLLLGVEAGGERDHDVGGVGELPAVCLAAEAAECRELEGIVAAAIATGGISFDVLRRQTPKRSSRGED